MADLVALAGRLFRADVQGFSTSTRHRTPETRTACCSYTGQGGLGLPDESYYREEKFAPMVQAYREYVATMFGLAGVADAEGAAGRVVALETALASHHWDNVTLRDPQKTYNLKTADEAARAVPARWGWFEAAGIDPAKRDEIVVSTPDFFAAPRRCSERNRWPVWQEWLTMRVHQRGRAVSVRRVRRRELRLLRHDPQRHAAEQGALEARRRRRRGAPSARPSARSTSRGTSRRRHKAAHADARRPTCSRRTGESITGLDWMGAETKGEALEKLDAFRAKIGYPDKWRDYSAVEIDRDDLLGNVRARAQRSTSTATSTKLGKPVDRDEWGMTPQTVNAYYNPLLNEIVFPAAILQPPFFDRRRRRRGELRRHRRGDRPRDRPRLRRPGPQSDGSGTAARTGGPRTTAKRLRGR